MYIETWGRRVAMDKNSFGPNTKDGVVELVKHKYICVSGFLPVDI